MPAFRDSPLSKPPQPVPRQFGVDRNRAAEFKFLLRGRVPHVAAIVVALSGSEMLSTYPLLMDATDTPLVYWAVFLIANDAFMFGVAVGVLTAAQVWVDDGWRRIAAIVLGVISTALVTSVMRVLFISGVSDAFGGMARANDSLSTFLYCLWMAIAFGSLLAIVYESQLRMESVNETLLRTRLDGERIERSTLESRLNGLKARVEPEFLFAVIARVEVLYETDAAAAERLLEDLIDFLRATLPRGLGDKSTLDHEMQLCVAFLAIERVLHGDALSVQVKIDRAAVKGYFPPGVLLPLLQQLLPARDQFVKPLHLLIAAERRDATVKIEFTVHASTSPVPEETLDAAAVSLRAFFADEARVSTMTAAFGGRTIAIEVPHVGA